jgi:hypothetical protein
MNACKTFAASGESGTERSEGAFFKRPPWCWRYVYVPFIEAAVCDPQASYLCNLSSCVPENDEERIGCGVALEYRSRKCWYQTLEIMVYTTQNLQIAFHNKPIEINKKSSLLSLSAFPFYK